MILTLSKILKFYQEERKNNPKNILNFPFFIAKKYLFSKSKTNAINIITIIASVGVMISAMILFLVLSHFSGLRKLSNKYLRASDPDIRISSSKGKILNYNSEIENKLKNNQGIALFSRVVEERAFLKNEEKKAITQLKGVDQNYNRIIMIDTCITGVYNLKQLRWLDDNFPNSAILGDDLIWKLNFTQEENPFQVIIPKSGKSFLNPANSFNSQTLFLYAGFRGLEDFNNTTFLNIETAQKLLNLKPNEISFIDVKIKPQFYPNQIRDDLQQLLGSNFKVETRKQLNKMFYKIVNIENFIVYLLGTLITIIALFNILGSIIMIIIDKKENLKTLFKIGATTKDIKKIFVLQGSLLTLIGLLIGLFLGISIIIIQDYTHIFMMSETQPYVVEFKWINVFIVFATIMILGYLASKIASSRINQNFISE